MCSGQLPVKRGPPGTSRARVCVTYQVPASQQQGRPASLCLWSLQPHLFTFLAGIVPSSQWALCTSESEGMIADTTPNMIIARDSWDSACSVCHSSFLTGLPYGFPWVPFVTASLVLATAGVPSPSITDYGSGNGTRGFIHIDAIQLLATTINVLWSGFLNLRRPKCLNNLKSDIGPLK